ncbi:MAG: hypothetical protein B6I29_00710 [Marinitoga sp. 4572_148]|nr:MAG: hypothetical protein B6I29_00710 [Marinitoga sp. 4572_148]
MIKTLINYKEENFEYNIMKKIYMNSEFTDFGIIDFSPGKILYAHNKLTKDIFDNFIHEAQRYFFTNRENIQIAFINPVIAKSFDINSKISSTEFILSKVYRFHTFLNELYKYSLLEFKNMKFYTKNLELESFLNNNLVKGNIKILGNSKAPLRFITIYPYLGIPKQDYKNNNIITNSHFFLMEYEDLDSKYSLLGQPFGGLVINKNVIFPYLYNRPALFIKNNLDSYVENIEIKNMKIIIDNTIYQNKKNCIIYTREDNNITPKQNGMDFIIINNKIIGYKINGETSIPDGGYVIHINKKIDITNLEIKYLHDEELLFSLQVGPSLIENKKVKYSVDNSFLIQKNSLRLPPTKFETIWKNSLSSRLAIGIKNKKIILLFANGTNSDTYLKAIDSKGFSFFELAQVLKERKIENAISLDGGGSMQIYINGGKITKHADRRKLPYVEYQRPIPGYIKFFCNI